MAQHDYAIANQGFPAFRSDLNDALAAIVSNNSGATEPTTMFAHQMWVDTAANPSILKIRNADNDAWITIGTIDQTGDTFTLTSIIDTDSLSASGDAQIANLLLKQNVSAYTTGTGLPTIARTSGFTGYVSGSLILQTGSDLECAIAFVTGSTPAERVRITNDGLTFNGDTAAANALDDYEEGTWTPVIADAFSGGNTGTRSLVAASYTKIGNVVHIYALINNIDTTGMTAANALFIRGLPFTSNADCLVTGAVVIDSITLQGGRTYVNSVVSANDTWMTFNVSGSALTDISLDVGDLTSGTADLRFAITYFT